MTDSVLAQAVACHNVGISIVPVHAGEKRPALSHWKQYQSECATIEQIIDWYTSNPGWGLGIVCGKVSGNLEMLELEGRAADLESEIAALAEASGLGDLFSRVCYTGWSETTPSGGVHYYYRLEGDVPGNTRLAQTTDREVMAETRGEGGFVVVAPTDGSHHPTGQSWQPRSGSPTTIPTLTSEEHDALWELFRSINQHMPPEAETKTRRATDGSGFTDGVTPGDDYEQRTTWNEILEPHGWTAVFQQGKTVYWRRPGKNRGVSATTGHADDRDRLYVFSTSAGFDTETPYTKFGAYTVLNHNGDHHAAAKTLAKEGYGQPGKQLIERKVIPLRKASIGDALDNRVTLTTVTTEGNTVTEAASEEATRPELALVTSTLVGSQDYEAREFVTQYRHVLAYCPDWGKWVAWNGHVWESQDQKTGGQSREDMREYLRSFPEDTPDQRKYKTKLLSDSQVSARLNLARTDVDMIRREKEFDQYPFELNTPDGIVNLHTGEMLPADSTRLHTKVTGVTPDFDMRTPLWDKFLEQTFGGDQEAIGYLQRLAGYSATGELREHVLPFMYGSGGNGKSVLLEVLVSVLGDYATVAPPNFLMTKAKNDETEFTVLIGRRLVVCSEVNVNSRFDEQRLKQLTGDRQIPARYLYGESFTFTASHTLWLVGNHKPKIPAGGESIWRRLQLVGFNHTVPREEQIKNLSERLFQEEGAGILAWVITGAVEYLSVNDLYPPQTVIRDTLEYEEEEDAIARFVEQCLIIGGGEYVRVSSADMNTKYRAWCSAENEKEISATALARELRSDKYGLGKATVKGKNYFTNVMLTNTDEDEPSDLFRDLGGGL